MGLLRQITKRALTTFVPRRRIMTTGPVSQNANAITMALTFDDGPHPDHTPRLLDTLKQWSLKGTFFIIGKNAQQYPQIVRRIAEEGHEVGNHTWSHSEPRTTSAAKFLDEIQQTDHLIEDLVGKPTSIVRPPKGELSFRKLTGLWSQRKSVILWNVDPRDYQMTSESDVQSWCSQQKGSDGDIVLMHDNHPWAAMAIQFLGESGFWSGSHVETKRISQWMEVLT